MEFDNRNIYLVTNYDQNDFAKCIIFIIPQCVFAWIKIKLKNKILFFILYIEFLF